MNQPEATRFDQEDEELERALMEALRPVDPPAGFADRTLAKAAGRLPLPADESAPGKILSMPSTRRWAIGALAATLLAAALAGDAVHLQRQHQREQQAQAQFQLAIEITGRTLGHTREQLARAGIQFGE